MSLLHVKTELLDVVYEEGGAADAPAVLLLHGWPDDVRGWRQVAPRINAAGYRTITPYLRGFGPTRFRSQDTVRDGRGVALAQDALDMADALGIESFAVIGHDWGARAAYTLAALAPDRVTSIAAIALAFPPRAQFHIPPFTQARRFWYQWLMALEQGADEVRRDPIAFARIQWETWSPAGWFTETEYAETAKSFQNPDACVEPASSESLERYFKGPYRRIVLEGVGHFPPREAPGIVAEAVIEHLGGTF